MNDAQAVERMNVLYDRMMKCNSTHGRHYNFIRMVDLWEKFECVRQLWDYVSDAFKIVNRFVRKTIFNLKTAIDPSINWNGIQPMGKGINQVYLIRLLDKDKQLIYSKVGTTTRETEKRMKEHLRYYYDDGVRFLEVDRLWNCGEIDPEGLESEFRARYIRLYKGTFRKNDRFIGVLFDLKAADEIVENYLREMA